MRDRDRQAGAIELVLGGKPKRPASARAYDGPEDWAQGEPAYQRAAREKRIREIDAILYGAAAAPVKTKWRKTRERNRARRIRLTRQQEDALRRERDRLAGEMPRGYGVRKSLSTRAAFLQVLRAAWPDYLPLKVLAARSGVLSGAAKGWIGLWLKRGWVERAVVGDDQLHPGAPRQPLWGYRLRPEVDGRSRKTEEWRGDQPDWLE